MQNTFATTPSEAVELVRDALRRGHTVILPTVAPDAVAVPNAVLVTTCRRLFGLTRTKALVLVELYEHGMVEGGRLRAALAADSARVPSKKALGVLVHKLRRKLCGTGVAITTVHGLGYSFDAEARARVRRLIAEFEIADSADAATTSEPDRKPDAP